MHRARLLFQFPEVSAAALHGALAPETDAEVPKTTSRVTREGDAVVVHLEAEDLSSLRAALNSHLRWADTAARAARLAR